MLVLDQSSGFLLAAQLNLRWHQQDWLFAGVDDGEQHEHPLAAIGSGGPYAQAASLALLQNTELPARGIVERALGIAADICIYTNRNLIIEELGA